MGRLLHQRVRKISTEAVRIKKKELGAHPKVYSKEVGRQISMVNRLGGEAGAHTNLQLLDLDNYVQSQAMKWYLVLQSLITQATSPTEEQGAP